MHRYYKVADLKLYYPFTYFDYKENCVCHSYKLLAYRNQNSREHYYLSNNKPASFAISFMQIKLWKQSNARVMYLLSTFRCILSILLILICTICQCAYSMISAGS